MENKIVRHIEVNGVTYDVPTIEGFDLVSAGLSQECQDEFNTHYKNGIEYAKYIKQTLDGASGNLNSKFIADRNIVFIPELDLREVTNCVNIFYGCINLEYVDKIIFKKYHLGNSQLFFNCVSLKKLTLVFEDYFQWHGNLIGNAPNIRYIDLGDISKITNGITISSSSSYLEWLKIVKWKEFHLQIYVSNFPPKAVNYIIEHALGEDDGAVARTFYLDATAKANWMDTTKNPDYNYYQAMATEKLITIA